MTVGGRGGEIPDAKVSTRTISLFLLCIFLHSCNTLTKFHSLQTEVAVESCIVRYFIMAESKREAYCTVGHGSAFVGLWGYCLTA